MNTINKTILNYPLFDGKNIIENVAITIENGTIVKINKSKKTNTNYFLMPGLIDAHTHIVTNEQINQMIKNGIVASCDVAASHSLIDNSKQFTIISSSGIGMNVLNGKSFVKKAIKDGAKYIKVLLFEPFLMQKNILQDICNTAHKNNIKVAIHATSVKAVKLSIECGVDILIHIPIKEELSIELINLIVQKNISVAPTLVMMKTFAYSNRNGYKKEHFQNAIKNVSLLHEYGVKILAATDANDGSFAPPVSYGSSLHYEMKLLKQCGLSNIEILSSATSNIVEAFNIPNFSTIDIDKKATFLLIEGRPDKKITDINNIKQIWINGNQII